MVGPFELGVLIWIVSGTVVGALASLIWSQKGGSPGAGFALGFFLGLIGLLYVGFAQPERTGDDRPTDNGDYKTCPRCAEQVRAAAVVCRFCGYEFPDASEGETSAGAESPSTFEGHVVQDVTAHALGVDWGRTDDGRVVYRTRESPEWSLYERDSTPLVPPRDYRQQKISD